MLAYLAEKSGLSRSSIFASVSLHGIAVISLLGFGSSNQLIVPLMDQPRSEVFEVAFESLPTTQLSTSQEQLPAAALTEIAAVLPETTSDIAARPIAQKMVRKQLQRTQKTAPAAVSDTASSETAVSNTTTTAVDQVGRSTTSPSPTQIMNLSSWINRHKFYPSDARRKGEEGTVLMRISLLDNGDLKSYQVVRSSGSQALDRAAAEILKRSAPYPQELAIRMNQAEVPLVFSLES